MGVEKGNRRAAEAESGDRAGDLGSGSDGISMTFSCPHNSFLQAHKTSALVRVGYRQRCAHGRIVFRRQKQYDSVAKSSQ